MKYFNKSKRAGLIMNILLFRWVVNFECIVEKKNPFILDIVFYNICKLRDHIKNQMVPWFPDAAWNTCIKYSRIFKRFLSLVVFPSSQVWNVSFLYLSGLYVFFSITCRKLVEHQAAFRQLVSFVFAKRDETVSISFNNISCRINIYHQNIGLANLN